MTLQTPSIALLIEDRHYPSLKRYLIDASGLAYYSQQDEQFAARIAQRLNVLELCTCEAYLDLLLDEGPSSPELDAIVAELTVGETFFFRHQEQFDALRQIVIPELLVNRGSQRRLRIWSAGCAIGAEAYSLAILLQHEFGQELSGWQVSIVGTDINRRFLDQARRAEYGEWAFRSAPSQLKETCFNRNANQWALLSQYKRCVSFRFHNLVQDPFPSLANDLHTFDLILCRNVMIYFDPDVVRRCIGQFHESLGDGGWLLVGHSEPDVETFRAFQTVNAPGAVLYQKVRRNTLSGVPRPLGQPTSANLVPTPLPCRSTPLPSLVPPGRLKSPAAKPVDKQQPAAHPEGLCIPLAELREMVDQGRWQHAAQECRTLLAADSLNATVHFFHALTLAQMERPHDAIESLRRAIYLDRAFVLAHYHLGLLLKRSHDAAGAQRALRNAARLLESMADCQTFDDVAGLTVGDLKTLTQMQLEAVSTCN